MDGFVNLLKPPGMSSGAAVARLKRLSRGARIGHAGTLDPEAAGVLPIMLGRATRLLDHFTDRSKSYVAEIAFTGATDTQDAQGTIIQNGAGAPERGDIEAILPRFTGDILQRPPAYSAVKRDGKRLYALARQGEMVNAEPRATSVFSLTLGEKTPGDGYLMSVDCGGGTYVRTLCHDIGQALGKPAHMRFLLRSRAGAFAVGDAVTFEEIEAAGTLEPFLLPMDFPLGGLPALNVPGEWEKPARNGVALPCGAFGTAPDAARLYIGGRLISIVQREGNLYKTRVGLGGTKDE